MKIIKPSVELLWMTPEPLKAIEIAGRTCYKSEDRITADSAEKFVAMLLEKKHEAMIEHACASVKIVCDRGVTHEIVRHRLASYAQESTRYANYSKEKFGHEISVVEPPGLEMKDYEHWEASCQEAEECYMALISNGIKPQIARSVLPTCLKTEIVFTANMREFRHFAKLRTAPAAHPQMREIADMIVDIFLKCGLQCLFQEFKVKP
jgi:thymidylate synthase (FAD)